MIIAIDGYSSCGKSTLAKDLSAELKFTYLDTGAMYRAVTLYFLDNNIPYEDPEVVEKTLKDIDISFAPKSNSTILNGLDVECEIRSQRISKEVSPVSTISIVRKFLVQQQRQIGENGNIVMDGRDIGTVVFPNAELKIFLTAAIAVRTQRRWEEMKRKGINLTHEEVGENLRSRDHIDSNRSDSPLSQAVDAVLLDNSNISRKEQIAMVLALVKVRMKSINKA